MHGLRDIGNFDDEEQIKCNEEDKISASKTAVLKVVKLDNTTFYILFFQFSY